MDSAFSFGNIKILVVRNPSISENACAEDCYGDGDFY
jgi:hypothetical protein